jgi:dienelactone hydrolase
MQMTDAHLKRREGNNQNRKYSKTKPQPAAKIVSAVLLATLLAQSPCLPPAQCQALGESQNQLTASAPANSGDNNKCTKQKIAGLRVAIWRPSATGKVPLVIFSHGSGGRNTKSRFITQALAQAGYLVIAPNHKDATWSGISLRPDFTYPKASHWTDKTFESRRADIVNLLSALHQDPLWDNQIDWSNLALCGHSLGGYTMFGLCGAWPSWKIDGVKAVLGFSPYCKPFVLHGQLGSINVPAMYQGGTRDSITRSVEDKGGAYDQTSPPVYFVEFDRAGHLAWTNFKHNKKRRELINYYTLAFLDKYLKGADDNRLKEKLAGVTELESKMQSAPR